MSLNNKQSPIINYQKIKQESALSEHNNDQTNENSILQRYQQILNDYSYARIEWVNISRQMFQQHNITLLSNQYQPFDNRKIQQSITNFIFSIVQTQFYGLQYMYEIIIGNFKLRILILNLQRDSDAGEDDIDSKQIGTGSFGAVRVLKINQRQYAIKRIPFQFKLHPQEGYDFELNKGEQIQLRNCLKEYCFYKIFSLLGIGPRIVKSNYDIICFSNCIEFKMQFCEVLTHRFATSFNQNDFRQCEKDLCEKLVLLHSLRMVHRDIKPENILYSNITNKFVFGDFGMATYIKENYLKKSLTKFVGTPNFCGQQMNNLLNGGSGMVNLYLNDLQSLQKTLTFLNAKIMSQNSRISSNAMSFNQIDDQFYYGGSMLADSQSNQSQPNLTDQSYIPTRNSLITLPTTHSLAPKKYASSINHYQSEIIYEICRSRERSGYIPKEYLDNLIITKYEEHSNQQILANLLIELPHTLPLGQNQDKFINYIKEWKNCSRHYGPQSQKTTNSLQRLIAISNQQSLKQLKSIKKKINYFGINSKISKLQIQTIKKIKNVQNYIFAFIQYLKNIIYEMAKQKNNQFNTQQEIFIAKEYIYCMRSILTESVEAKKVTRLTLLFFKKKFPKAELLNIDETPITNVLQFCLLSLKRYNQESTIDTVYYLIYLYENMRNNKWFQIQNQMITIIQQLLLKLNYKDNYQLWIVLCFLIRIASNCFIQGKFQSKYDSYLNICEALVQQKIKCETSIDTKGLFAFRYLQIDILRIKQEYSVAISLCKSIQADFQRQNEIKNFQFQIMHTYKLLGQFYLFNKNYQLSQIYLLKVVEQIQKYYGCLSKPQQVYQVLANIAAIYYQRQQYEKSRTKMQQIIQFLQKCHSFPKKIQSLTYILKMSIITLLKDGLKTDFSKKKVAQLLQKLVQNIYLYFKQCKQLKNVIYFQYIFNVQARFIRKIDKYFILEQSLNAIKRKQQFIEMLTFQYRIASYQLGKYYILQKKLILVGMKYLWANIRVTMLIYHLNQLQFSDFQIFIIYAQCLVKTQSNRIAIRFLSKFLKHIPQMFAQVKYKAFEIMYKALKTVANKKQHLYYQLIKHNCACLRKKQFKGIPKKLSKNIFQRKLVELQIKKLCFVQLNQHFQYT